MAETGAQHRWSRIPALSSSLSEGVLCSQVDEDMIRLLLPYLLHGVADAGEVSTDFRAATYMILVQLCTIATLASDFLEGQTSKESTILYAAAVLIIGHGCHLWWKNTHR